MLRPIDDYFLQQTEPIKGCMEFLRSHILQLSPDIVEAWRYGMPVYYYKNKMFCHLWVHKKFHQPYISFVDGGLMQHPALLQENRSRMKIFLVDPSKDIPLKVINELFKEALALRK